MTPPPHSVKFKSIMLMAVNIGNSSTRIGFFLFDGQEPFVHRFPTHPLRSAREYFEELKAEFERYGFTAEQKKMPDAGALCSVVPSHNDVFLELLAMMLKTKEQGRKVNKPLIISHKTALGMKFDVENPAALGADRIAASYGAWKMYGGPVCVIDAGTATTVNFVTADGLFLGGAIMPGLGLMRDSLQSGTAGLPYVDIEADTTGKSPKAAIGTNTTGAILSGIIFGTAGAISRIIEEAELMRLEKFKVALTGGYAGLVAPCLKRLDFHEPALALKGIRLISIAVF